jgi:hypothetical protein
MWQTDTLIYATDIADYVDREFGSAPSDSAVDPGKISRDLVPCWSAFIGNFRGPWTLGAPD